MGAGQLSARAFFFGDSILGQAPRSPPSRDVPFNTSYWGPNPSWRRTVNTSTTVPPVKEFWPQVLAELRERVPGPTFHSLLEDTTGEIGGNTVTVTAPNSYVVDMLDRHLGDGIKQTCAQVAGGPVDVVYIYSSPFLLQSRVYVSGVLVVASLVSTFAGGSHRW